LTLAGYGLNFICPLLALLALLGAHHILHVSRTRVIHQRYWQTSDLHIISFCTLLFVGVIRTVRKLRTVQSHWHRSYMLAWCSPWLWSTDVPFIVSPSMADLSHRNPAYAGEYRCSQRTLGHKKRYRFFLPTAALTYLCNYKHNQYTVKHNTINDFIKVHFLHCLVQQHVAALVMSHLQVDNEKRNMSLQKTM